MLSVEVRAPWHCRHVLSGCDGTASWEELTLFSAVLCGLREAVCYHLWQDEVRGFDHELWGFDHEV